MSGIVDRGRRVLTAGPVSAHLENGELRAIELRGRQVISRIYFALRDQNWGTVEGRVMRLEIDQDESGFRVFHSSEHQEGDIHFVADTSIVGESDGTIRIQLEGRALSTFMRNRIGLCVLHPITAAGDHVRVVHPDGSSVEGSFPTSISPVQPFIDIAELLHYLPDGDVIRISFRGDTFEMEDQRNWTDANFKTYGTPLRLPFPVKVYTGHTVSQSIILRPALSGESSSKEVGKTGRKHSLVRTQSSVEQPDALAVGASTGRPLISLGLSWSQHMKAATSRELAFIASLRLSHVRLDLSLTNAHPEEELSCAAEFARRVRIPLALSLCFGTEVASAIEHLCETLKHTEPRVASWTILSEGLPTTSTEHLTTAHRILSREDRVEPIGGGTQGFFAELNENRLPTELVDFVEYRITPQVHASDDLSVMENLSGQAPTVESALLISRGKPVHLGSVTLKMQTNPYATVPPLTSPENELPPEVDPRQRSVFAASWTLGSVKSLSEAAASRATYYEMIGWKGVMERSSGSSMPSHFPSRPGELFPLFYLFRALGKMEGGVLASVANLRGDLLSGLAVRKDALLRLFVANHKSVTRAVRIYGLDKPSAVWLMDSSTGAPKRRTVSHLDSDLVLQPYGVAWVDSQVSG